MATTGPSRILIAIVLAAIVVAGGVGIWAADYYLHPRPIAGPLAVDVGDNVTVNYIGQFGNGSQVGRTFDTSLYSVYLDNATYPKSLQYTPHGSSPSAFTPLPVYVGAFNGQYVVNGVNFTGVVAGFWQGMLGLQVNQTRWVTFPDSLGYHSWDPACMKTLPLAFTVPVLATVATSDFATTYPGVTPNPGITFPDPVYKWTDLIFSMNSTDIVVESLPTLGYVSALGGWNATVTGITTSTISMVNDITPQNYGGILGTFAVAKSCAGGPNSNQFVISGLNSAAGTFTENWNSPAVGYTLTFRITIVQIVTS